MQIKVERDEDGSFLVSDEMFAMYGEGDSLPAALRDYATTLTEYEGLLNAGAEAGGEPQAVLLRSLHDQIGFPEHYTDE